MSASAKVTVVILNWNGWKDTLRCVDSLRALDDPQPEIILVDNSSTDDSVAKIRHQHPALEILVSPANLGFGGGCNIGMREALARSADYIWLINTDAIAKPDALQAMVRLAEQQPRLAAIGSVIYDATARERVQLWGGARVTPWLGRTTPLEQPGALHFVSGASLLLKADALREIGLFDEKTFFMYWEDTDLGFRLRRAGWQLATAQDSQVWHRGPNGAGRGSPKIDEYYICSAVRFFRRHMPWPRLAAFSLLASMLAKRILRGHWHRVRAVIRGYRAA